MRPYTGIGVFVFSQSESVTKRELQIPLYNEPGLSRVGILNSSKLSVNEWIFGLSEENPPLIVSARKGDWLQVFYDDAGREAWIEQHNRGHLLSWEQFLKLQTCRMLPGLQPPFYQLLQQIDGKSVATLTPKQIFKVLKLENGWSMILTEQGQLGWLKWQDNDRRLTMGIGKQ